MGLILYHHPPACRQWAGCFGSTAIRGRGGFHFITIIIIIILGGFDRKRIHTRRFSASSFPHGFENSSDPERHAQIITYLPSWWQNCIPQFPRSLKKYRRIRSQLPDAEREPFHQTPPIPLSCRDNEEGKNPSAEAKGRPWMLLCLYHLQEHRRMLREREDEPGSGAASPSRPAPPHMRARSRHPPREHTNLFPIFSPFPPLPFHFHQKHNPSSYLVTHFPSL